MSSRPQDQPMITGVCVYVCVRVFTSGSVSAGRVGRSSVGQKTRFSCGSTRGNSFCGQSQCCGRAALLEGIQSVCSCSPSVRLLSTHSPLLVLSLLPPLSSCLKPFYEFRSTAWPVFVFLLWTVVLLLPVYPVSHLGHSFTPLFPESTAAPHNKDSFQSLAWDSMLRKSQLVCDYLKMSV